MRYTATNPDRIADKARECRFFLLQMAEHEQQMDIEKFLYCLSAFLSAFRTAIYRSFGVAQTRKGSVAARGFAMTCTKTRMFNFSRIRPISKFTAMARKCGSSIE